MYQGNPRNGGIISTHSRYRALRAREERFHKQFGNDLVFSRFDKPAPPSVKDFKPGNTYKASDLEAMADELLREQARTEVCRTCYEEDRNVRAQGEATGEVKHVPQELEDGSGTRLVLEFNEFRCPEGHTWWEGEGKERGIDGDAPILFEEHFASRKRREIYTTLGTPDPSIVAGIYNRIHPQGRKVNSPEQRQRHGASFYR
jgi:hypothetical protein